MAINRLAVVRGVSLRHCDTAGVALFAVAFFFMAGPVGAWAQALPAFNWIREVDNSGLAYSFAASLGTDAQGNVYVVGSTTSLNFPVKNAVQSQSASPGSYDVVVTKFDPAGNIVYSTYFGGNADDIATAVAVDSAGNVYVAGTTASTDFPTTAGSYSPSLPPEQPPGYTSFTGAIFLFKLNPDGSVGYSTYFTSASAAATPQAIAVDGTGSVYLTGITFGGVPTTAGAYQTICACTMTVYYGPPISHSDAFLTKFDPTGSKLIYSTYLGILYAFGSAVAVAADGSAYVGSPTGIYRFDPTGSSLLASMGPMVAAQAMTVGPNGNVYLAGTAGTGTNQFQPTAGVFQSSPGRPVLPGQGGLSPAGIAIMDPQLQNTLAATYFGDFSYGQSAQVLALDSSGNVYFGGYTSRTGLPTRTPLQLGFGGSLATGFVSELSADLSTLLFSSQFGDGEYFGVTGLGIGANGSFALAGATDHGTVWANSVQPANLPPLRVDAVENAASRLNDLIAPGETIYIRGAGFDSDAQLLLGGSVVPAISVTPTLIAATVPSDLPIEPVRVQVQSGGAASNAVLLNVATVSPGLFSVDGSGFGQGYILNKDGTLNSPANPAAPGDKITVFATGVGPVSFVDVYAVTEFPGYVFIDSFFCDGVAAVMGPVAGFPGSVYQLSIFVPDPAAMVAGNPNLLNFTFPAQVGVVLQIDGASTQNGLAISIGQ